MIYYIIPARKNSKGLKYKNRQLFEFTARELKDSPNVYMTTDDEVIAEKASLWGFNTIWRPNELATDEANIKDVLLHVIHELELKSNDVIIMCYLTYPGRKMIHINLAYNYFEAHLAKSLLCKKEASSHPYLCMYKAGKFGKHGEQIVSHDLYRRQDYPDVFELSHFVFIGLASEIEKLNKNLYNTETIFYDANTEIHDIDYAEDYVKWRDASLLS